MAGKLQEYRRIAETAQRQLTGSLERWQSFLTTASRLYKYPYHEQVMIHAQRPDATACAEYDVWNNTMRRYVRRGAKGIALIDIRSDLNRLRYVFDISDTGARENSRSVNLWQLRDEHLPAVSAMLETGYAIPANADFGAQLKMVAAQLVREYWEENKRDILDTLANSFLEDYDEFNAGAAFRNAAQASVSYCLMSRCGLEPSDYLEREDFMSVFDFNTPDAAAALGTAVSGINQQVLREIGATIRRYEREKIAGRSITHGDDLHESRGLSGSERQTEQSGNEASWKIRASAESIPEGTPPDSLESADSEGSTVLAPSGDRRNGTQTVGRNAAADGGTGRSDRAIEAEGTAGMGGADEQPESAGRGDHSKRTGVQLTESEKTEPAIIAEEPPQTLSALDDGWFPPGNEDNTPFVDENAGQFEQLSLFGLFATEEEQIAHIDEAESMVMPSAFSMFISQDDIDHILRTGGNEEDARMRIAAEFSKQKSLENRAAFLKALYHGGSGLITENGKISAWYGEDGIHIASGDAARYFRSAQVISWEDAAKRTEELLDSGAFATNLEIAEAPRNERLRIATEVWNLYHDFSDEAKSQGHLSCLENIRSTNYPKETERLTDNLANPAFTERLLAEYRVFLDAYRENRELMRFHYHRSQALLTRLEDLSLPRKEYHSDRVALPETGRFITEDEIADSLANGSSFEGGKTRIYEFFQTPHAPKESADFLKKEYGIGGRTHAVSGENGSYEDHGSRGIVLKKSNCADIQMNWSNVASRISELIRLNRYFTPDEQTLYDKALAQDAARNTVTPSAAAAEPSYAVGDTVYLDNKPFVITEVGLFDVYLLDPSQVYPIFRAESKERLAALLRRDERNAHLFTPKSPAQEQPEFVTTPVAFYPAEKMNLPYDIEIQTFHVPEPEHDPLSAEPAVPESPAHSPAVSIPIDRNAQNFRITDDNLGVGGAKAKFRANMDAINLLKELEFDGRQATPEEQTVLAKYVGWGGLADAFDENKANWSDEFQELYVTLSPEEYAAARASTLNAHYTSPTVIHAIYEALDRMGFETGNILEKTFSTLIQPVVILGNGRKWTHFSDSFENGRIWAQ